MCYVYLKPLIRANKGNMGKGNGKGREAVNHQLTSDIEIWKLMESMVSRKKNVDLK